jgi:hypothetical protein
MAAACILVHAGSCGALMVVISLLLFLVPLYLKMSIVQYPEIKKTSSKWLLPVVLLLSFFTFSGFIAPTQIKLVKPQTTLVIGGNTGLSKSITYKRALVKTPVIEQQVLVFIDLHNRQTNVRLVALSNFCVQPKTALFYRAKTNLPNADDDPTILEG